MQIAEDGTTYDRYRVQAVSGAESYTFAEIDVPVGNTRYMRVRTIKDAGSVPVSAKVDPVMVKLTPTNADGSEPKTIEFRLTFAPGTTAKVTGVTLNFRKDATLRENVDYSVKKDEDITGDGQPDEVFYFESDFDFIDLTTALIPDEVGIRSFEESRSNAFASGSAYEIKCEIANVDFFATNSKYHNKTLDNGILSDNRRLEKKGIGYKKLTVQCNKGLDKISESTYYIRYVSPSGQNYYKVPNANKTWYDIANEEVVHVRKGEAAVPRYYEDANGTQPAEEISAFNPCIEYKITNLYPSGTDTVIATASRDASTYRVNGISTGIVKVTAVGTVNRGNEQEFELYVNKDSYFGGFSINFDDAIDDKTMDTGYAVDGRQETVLVGITPEGNTGIPDISWSLEWKDADEKAELSEYAVIKPGAEPGTAVITTKIYSNKEINVVATAGQLVKKMPFTIKQVGVVSIATLAEKEGETPVVAPNGDNAGKCMVGQSFTLYPADYLPKNANDLLSSITWESSDETLATVDKEGKVTALAPTGDSTVQITATCRAAGGAGEKTTYRLTIEQAKVPVTEIQADDFDLEFKGANLSMTGRVKVLPANASDPTVTYKSSDESIVAIDEKSGLMTANSIGSCMITITSVSNPEVSKTITVTVKGGSNESVQPTAAPGTVTPGTVVPGTVVTPNTPTVMPGIQGTPGASAGNSGNGKKVKAPVIKIAKGKIKVKKSTKITIANKAKGAKVTYTLDKKSKKIVSVSKKGGVKGKKKGSAKIVVTVKQNGKTYKKTLKIKVTK